MTMKWLIPSRRSRIPAVLIAFVLLLGTVIPAAAVTFGELDGENHPYVGLMVFDVDGSAAPARCSRPR